MIARANDTLTGLGACVWSANIQYAEKLGSRLEVGTVWLNSFPKPLPMAYFGGRKDSGVGGEWGREGLFTFCNTQSVHMYKNHL